MFIPWLTIQNRRFPLFSGTANAVKFRKTHCLPELTARLTYGKHSAFPRSQKFSPVFLYFPRRRIQGNSRKRMFSSVHRSVNARKLLRVPAFSEVFLCFSRIFPDGKRAWTQENACFPMFTVRWTFGKYRVFLCSQEFSYIFWDSELRWIQENACSLAFTVQLMGGKLHEFQRFPRVFLHFLGRCIRVFFSAHRPALFAHSHPVFEILLIFLQSHDLLATNVQGTKAHSLSQSKQQKQEVLLILKIRFI